LFASKIIDFVILQHLIQR